MPYDVTIITVRPGILAQALTGLEKGLRAVPGGILLACWYAELGALNQIVTISHHDGEASLAARRDALARSEDPFGIKDCMTSLASDTFLSFPFVEAMRPGVYGPVFEVRSYVLRPDGLPPTIASWQAALPRRAALSAPLAAMYSVTGPMPRFLHIWPYPNLDERQRIRAKAIETGVWPPPGGPEQLLSQRAEIYLPAPFSPIR